MIDVPNHTNLPDQDWATDPVPDELPDNRRSPTRSTFSHEARPRRVAGSPLPTTTTHSLRDMLRDGCQTNELAGDQEDHGRHDELEIRVSGGILGVITDAAWRILPGK